MTPARLNVDGESTSTIIRRRQSRSSAVHDNPCPHRSHYSSSPLSPPADLFVDRPVRSDCTSAAVASSAAVTAGGRAHPSRDRDHLILLSVVASSSCVCLCVCVCVCAYSNLPKVDHIRVAAGTGSRSIAGSGLFNVETRARRVRVYFLSCIALQRIYLHMRHSSRPPYTPANAAVISSTVETDAVWCGTRSRVRGAYPSGAR